MLSLTCRAVDVAVGGAFGGAIGGADAILGGGGMQVEVLGCLWR